MPRDAQALVKQRANHRRPLFRKSERKRPSDKSVSWMERNCVLLKATIPERGKPASVVGLKGSDNYW